MTPEERAITEWYTERLGVKIYDASLEESEAKRQAYHETKRVFGRVTEAIKREYSKAIGSDYGGQN
jgi:hypothetical protein